MDRTQTTRPPARKTGPDRRIHRLMRMDDHGTVFEISRHEDVLEAERLARSFEARGHKQMYWVEPVQ